MKGFYFTMAKNNNITSLTHAVIIGSIFAIISVFVFSLFMYFFDFPINVQSGGLYILLNLSLFISSVHAGKKVSGKGYLYGVFSGLIFIGILLLINILINSQNFIISKFLIRIPLLLLISVIGGIFGANLKK